MVDVRGDVLRPPHGTTPAAVKSNIKPEIRLIDCCFTARQHKKAISRRNDRLMENEIK